MCVQGNIYHAQGLSLESDTEFPGNQGKDEVGWID